MNTFVILFFNARGKNYDSCLFTVGENESFLYALSDALFIHQELTPVPREWEIELVRSGKVRFSYHGCELVTVRYDEKHDFHRVYVFND